MMIFGRILLFLCSVMIAASAFSQDLDIQLPSELPTDDDSKDFPRDFERKIVEESPLLPEKDHPLLRRSNQSLIPWKDLKHEEFLSVHRWVAERAEHDKDSLWKVKLRLSSTPEQIGKVISCIGTCVVHRGTIPTRLRWLSRINEGDEITTSAESYLWMMLTDGTLVRLSPETSLGLLEMNLTKDKFFFHARLNHGHVFWKPRNGFSTDSNRMTETDRLFLPVMDPEANIEFFQRAAYQKLKQAGKDLLLADHGIRGQADQQAKINELIASNNTFTKIQHETLLVAPNASVYLKNMPITMFYNPGDKSYIKMWGREDSDQGEPLFGAGGEVSFRGYMNLDRQFLAEKQYVEISPDGRTQTVLETPPPLLAASEILYKRIPTILLVREKWIAESRGLWDSINDSEKLATAWGIRLWTTDWEKRIDFLREHTRRVETSNLRALQRLVKTPAPDFDGRFFSRGLEKYFSDIKRRHSFLNTSVLDMIPLHYYGWVLINAKQQ